MLSIRAKQNGFFWQCIKNISLEKKKYLISSTEMSALFHSNKRKSKRRLFNEKTKRIKRPNIENAAVKHGRMFEDPARRIVQKLMGKDFELLQPGCIVDPSEPICCSPDGIFNSLISDLMIGLEAKCPFLPKNFVTEKEDIPIEYLIQCFTCIHVTRADSWLLAFFEAQSEFLSVFEIFPNDELWEDLFVPETRLFVQHMAQDNTSQAEIPKKNEDDKKIQELIRSKLLEGTKKRFDLSSHQ